MWISVNDRLPHDTRDYLVTDGCLMWVAAYAGVNAGGTKGYDWFNGYGFIKPTHWMELPELPSEFPEV